VKLEAEVAPCLTAVAFEKLVPVIVTVLPKTADLGVFTFELANEVIVGAETSREVTLTEFKPVT
jgi:hypothetical protein